MGHKNADRKNRRREERNAKLQEKDGHVHIQVGENAVASFSKTPSKETLEVVKKLVEKANKIKFNG